MKPRIADIQVERSHESRVIDMTISPTGMAGLMSLLTSMYTDPALAVIREYTTNAIDANIDSGETRPPVDVYLPSDLGEPHFIVRDYGDGMDEDDIDSVYSRYAESTKRNSNDAAGMFGIGSKSGLAYVSQILVDSIKLGVKTSTTITRTSAAPQVSIDSVASTHQPNGTTVKIPVVSLNSFNEKARSHFKMLKKGLVHVNGEDIGGEARLLDLGDGIFTTQMSVDTIVMGNVPYPIPKDITFKTDRYGGKTDTRKSRISFIIDVPNGDFMPAPSREGLELNDVDKKRIRLLLQDADNKYISHLRSNVMAATSVVNGLKALGAHKKNTIIRSSDGGTGAKELRSALVIDGFTMTTYGVEVPGLVLSDQGNWSAATAPPNDRKVVFDSMFRHGYESVFFYNSPDKVTSYYRDKISKFLSDRNLRRVDWYGVENKADIPTGLPESNMIDFAEVQNWKRPRAATAAAQNKWCVVTKVGTRNSWNYDKSGLRYYTYEEPNTKGKKDIVYVSPSDSQYGVDYSAVYSAASDDNIVLVRLSRNQFTKFKRDNPKAVWVKEWYKSYSDAQLVGLTDDHFRRPGTDIPALDSDLHRRYNERMDELAKMRKEAMKKLGEVVLYNMAVPECPELVRIRGEIASRYPYAPSRLWTKSNKREADVYMEAMKLYYEEKKND
jgi:hypothetical protein